jgi:UDP-N-acetyl-2-amino-2-deoxyglucuronate dehydrogenase
VRRHRFGIVGCGVIGPFHGDAIQIAGGEVAAVCDIVSDRADAMAAKYEAKPFYDYAEMLKDESIDIVNVCTPSGMHAEMGIRAAEHNKHVITEKPIDINLRAADALIDACRKHKVKLQVIFQKRFDEAARILKNAIDSGKFGKLLMCDTYIKWYRTQDYYDEGDGWRGTLALDGGGALINQSVHNIDLLRWLAGPVESLQAYTGTVAHTIEGEDVGVAVLRFRNGAVGVIEGSTACWPGLTERVEIHGEKGMAVLAGSKLAQWKFVDGEEEPPATEEKPSHKQGTTAIDPRALAVGGHAQQMAEMMSAIDEDTDPPVTGADGRNALEVVRAIYIAAKTQRPVRFPVQDDA